MKKNLFYSIALLMILLLSQCGPTTQEAMDYNDELIIEQKLVVERINDLDKAFLTHEPAKIELALNAAKTQIDKSIPVIEELGGFYEDTKFSDACLDLIKLFKSQLNNEYNEQFEIYKLSDDDYTEESKNRYNELLGIINDNYTPAYEKFSIAQDDFAEKWGFDLEY